MAFLMCGCLICTVVNVSQARPKKTNRLLILHMRNVDNARCLSHFSTKTGVYYTVSESHFLIFINYGGLSMLTSSAC